MACWVAAVGIAVCAGLADGDSAAPNDELAAAAHQVLRTYCFGCHGPDVAEPKGGLRLDSLPSLQKGGKSGKPAVVVGNPDESLLWQRVGVKRTMPPADKPQPDALERFYLKKWIEAGAALPVSVPPKPFPPKTTTPASSTAERPSAGPEHAALAERGYQILKKYCFDCHGKEFKTPRLNVLDHAGLLEDPKGDAGPFVVPGNPDESLLWDMLGGESMPPEKMPQPTEGERELVRQWIAAGFPKYVEPKKVRKLLAEKDILVAIRSYLQKELVRERRFFRFFSLAHLHNSQNVGEDELRLYRAALSKLINSLSRGPEVMLPTAIDEAQTVFAIDLRDYRWEDLDRWKKVLAEYPYGIKPEEPEAANLFDEIEQLAGGAFFFDGVPYLRADWFIANASRPPLYHDLLGLPATTQELEKELGVDVERDFLSDRLVRAAFLESGISDQNRLVDRHPSSNGFYWKSYDFAENEGSGSIATRPLGPRFDRNPFKDLAFEHDGGEILFSLPNGLLGFFLADGTGRRIDEGPRDIVRDRKEIAGTDKIVVGVSCIGCHRNGLIRFEDAIRSAYRGNAAARQKVEALFKEKEDVDRLVERDIRRFLDAVDEATGGYLKVGEDASKPIEDFAEPVAAIVSRYTRDLSIEDIARELDRDPAAIKGMLQGNQSLIERFGLGPLLDGKRIKRDVWHSLRGGSSPFQEVGR